MKQSDVERVLGIYGIDVCCPETPVEIDFRSENNESIHALFLPCISVRNNPSPLRFEHVLVYVCTDLAIEDNLDEHSVVNPPSLFHYGSVLDSSIACIRRAIRELFYNANWI